MEKVKRKYPRAKSGKTDVFSRFELIDFILSTAAFFIGRVIVFSDIALLSVAYMSMFLNRKNKFYISAMFTMFGILTKLSLNAALRYVAAVIALAVLNFFMSSVKAKASEFFNACAAAAAIAITGLFIAFLSENMVYLSLMAILEAVLCFSLSLIMSKGLSLMRRYSQGGKISNEELISLMLLTCGFIAGLSDIYIKDVALRYCFSSLVIMVFAYKGGAAYGATTGLIIGVMLNISGYEGLEYVVAMAVSGFFAGTLSDLNRIFTATAFVAASVISAFLLSGRIVDMNYLLSAMFSSLMFIIIPQKYTEMLSETLRPTESSGRIYGEKLKEQLTYKISATMRAFEKLSEAITMLSEKKREFSQKEAACLINEVVLEECEECENKDYCWQENYYTMFQSALGMLAACEKKDLIEPGDISKNFFEDCVDARHFAFAVQQSYDAYRSKVFWGGKMAEVRELMSRQLRGTSVILASLRDELCAESAFYNEAEELLYNELVKHRLEIKGLSVAKSDCGKYEVLITHKAVKNANIHKRMASATGKILGRKMLCEEMECIAQRTRAGYFCTVKLNEAQELKIVFGFSTLTKFSETDSGDSSAYAEIKNGVYLFALSDGMGSGKKAKKESEAAVGLLENFLAAGFDKESSVKLINSALLLKSTEDMFSTLDFCTVDLYKRQVEFIKIGAAPSYFLRNDEISVISSNTLPVGILSDIKTESVKKSLKSGDVIIMATDGLTDLDTFDEEEDEESWTIRTIRDACNLAPQNMADELIDEARKKTESKPTDDITVFVARVY